MDVINRNNYETYFLLFADNELTPAERQEVEAFVRLHPDLAAEFDAVLQTRFSPEPVSFNAKNLLYKPEPSPFHITINNCEEYFILYYDNELSAEEKKAVEQFVAENEAVQDNFRLLGAIQFTAEEEIQFPELAGLYRLPNGQNYTQLLNYIDGELPVQEAQQWQKEITGNKHLEQEYHLLAQTKLQPDMAVVFPGKNLLYRKERKDAPVIPLWLRFAAAAAVLVFITWVAFFRNTNNNGGGTESLAGKEQPAAVQPKNNNAAGTLPANNTSVAVNAENNVATTNNAAQVVNSPLNSGENKTNVVTSFSPERNNNIQAVQTVQGPELKAVQQPVLAREEQQPAVLPEHIKKIIDNPQINEAMANAPVQQTSNNTIPEQQNGNEYVNQGNMLQTEEKEAIPVSFASLPADKIVEKTGLRGVGRKITRFFERKIKNSRNSLSIGGFDVALAR